jgi:hypothetical protein
VKYLRTPAGHVFHYSGWTVNYDDDLEASDEDAIELLEAAARSQIELLVSDTPHPDDPPDFPPDSWDVTLASVASNPASLFRDILASLSGVLNDAGAAALVADAASATTAALRENYVSATVATGAGFDPTGAANSRTALQAKIDAVNASGGGTVVVKAGHTLKLGSPLYARSNVRLYLEAGSRLLRGYAGAPAMIRNETLSPAGKISNFSIAGPGKIGAPNTTDGGQILWLYGDDLLLSEFNIDTYGGGTGSQACLIGGDRNLMFGVKVTGSADEAGTGGIRMYGGKHFRAIGCHVESGDDALQFVPLVAGDLGNLDIEDSAYVGCTGGSTEARFMVAINSTNPVGAGGMTCSIKNVSWIGCHGYGQKRGVVIANTDSTGSIENLGFVDCSVDMLGGEAIDSEVRIERTTTSGPVRNIRFEGFRVINPNASCVSTVADATAGIYVEDVSLIDCVLDGPANGESTVEPQSVDGFTIRGGVIASGTGGAAASVIAGQVGVGASKRVRVLGPRITGVRDGVAGVRLPETIGYRVRDTIVLPAAGATTAQGMSLVSASTGGVIEGNDFSAVPGTKVAGTIAAGTIIRDNVGLVTRAKGQDTVPPANTLKNVTHGLGRTPALSSITLTPGNTEAAASSYYVSAVAANTFTITLAATPGGAGALFNWTADATIV